MVLNLQRIIEMNCHMHINFRCEICNFDGQHVFGQPIRKRVSLSAKLDNLLKPSQSTIDSTTREPSIGTQKGIYCYLLKMSTGKCN